jgi:hypothetical protein
MVSFPKIKTIIVNNRKVFAKPRYEPGDVVWWVENMKVTGIVMNVRGYYCHIRDEYNNEYIKSHLELFLDEANVIQSLMNDMIQVKREIHFLQHPTRENTSFSIHARL